VYDLCEAVKGLQKFTESTGSLEFSILGEANAPRPPLVSGHHISPTRNQVQRLTQLLLSPFLFQPGKEGGACFRWPTLHQYKPADGAGDGHIETVELVST
jgi:hypothetical protein